LAADTVFKFNPLCSIRDIFYTIAGRWQSHSQEPQDRRAFHRQTPADYDNDGFLDAFFTGPTSLLFHNNGDLFVGNEAGNNALYLNNGNTNNWLTIQCLGRVSNRAAIGAKIRIKATIGGKTMWQLREISGGGGLWSLMRRYRW
jgi:hypothetical protein